MNETVCRTSSEQLTSSKFSRNVSSVLGVMLVTVVK